MLHIIHVIFKLQFDVVDFRDVPLLDLSPSRNAWANDMAETVEKGFFLITLFQKQRGAGWGEGVAFRGRGLL